MDAVGAFPYLNIETEEHGAPRQIACDNFFLIALFITQLEQSSVEIGECRAWELGHRQRLNIPLAADN